MLCRQEPFAFKARQPPSFILNITYQSSSLSSSSSSFSLLSLPLSSLLLLLAQVGCLQRVGGKRRERERERERKESEERENIRCSTLSRSVVEEIISAWTIIPQALHEASY